MTTTTALLNDVNIDAVASLAAAVEQDASKGDTTWRSTVTWDGGFRSKAQVRDFTPIYSDEPQGLGGTDHAPNPVEQLLSALGNCLAVGYAANATALGIDVDSIEIQVSGDLDLHSFLGLREGHAGFSSIAVNVDIQSSATEEQLADLHARVTSTSPVGHTLGAAIPVEYSLV